MNNIIRIIHNFKVKENIPILFVAATDVLMEVTSIAEVVPGEGLTGSLGAARAASWAASLATSFFS